MVWVSLGSERLQSIVVRRLLAAMETRPQWFYAVAFLVSFEMATLFNGLRSAGRAVLHAALVGLHLGSVHSGPSRPIDEWGGLLATAGFLVIAAYVVSILYRKLHGVRIPLRRLEADRNELSDFSQLWHDGCGETIIGAQDVDRNHSPEV